MSGPTPEKVMQLITGAWAASILGTAAGHGLFTALEDNPDTAAGIAKRVGISPRGAQALLDGLTGLGLLSLRGGEYHNTPDASAFLVMGKPAASRLMEMRSVDYLRLVNGAIFLRAYQSSPLYRAHTGM